MRKRHIGQLSRRSGVIWFSGAAENPQRTTFSISLSESGALNRREGDVVIL
jgi:hypothetical protein